MALIVTNFAMHFFIVSLTTVQLCFSKYFFLMFGSRSFLPVYKTLREVLSYPESKKYSRILYNIDIKISENEVLTNFVCLFVFFFQFSMIWCINIDGNKEKFKSDCQMCKLTQVESQMSKELKC